MIASINFFIVSSSFCPASSGAGGRPTATIRARSARRSRISGLISRRVSDGFSTTSPALSLPSSACATPTLDSSASPSSGRSSLVRHMKPYLAGLPVNVEQSRQNAQPSQRIAPKKNTARSAKRSCPPSSGPASAAPRKIRTAARARTSSPCSRRLCGARQSQR
ncbi:hypothetical protein BV25DRAFT_699660 [Artomyces pyxidatus]|uniref:Uncharacterized protein n=1 Tax=Artomyces pyxidatus TaxID=48021 RepID=A0ACB8T1R8_9AGAM|nr:hypothetical protein BV25DRAFT_699660 [Artomyces pyxidatus]